MLSRSNQYELNSIQKIVDELEEEPMDFLPQNVHGSRASQVLKCLFENA